MSRVFATERILSNAKLVEIFAYLPTNSMLRREDQNFLMTRKMTLNSATGNQLNDERILIVIQYRRDSKPRTINF